MKIGALSARYGVVPVAHHGAESMHRARLPIAGILYVPWRNEHLWAGREASTIKRQHDMTRRANMNIDAHNLVFHYRNILLAGMT